MNPTELRQKLHDRDFDTVLSSWDKYGVDHKCGGLMCSLDYDGTLANDPIKVDFRSFNRMFHLCT